MKMSVLALAFTAVLGSSMCPLTSYSLENKVTPYVYDTEDFGSYLRDLVYIPVAADASGKESTIPLYIAYPKTQPIKSVAIFLHGITSHKDVWWQGEGPYSSRSEYKSEFLEKGIAVVAIDARYHGQRASEIGYLNPKTEFLFKGSFDSVYSMIAGTVADAKQVITYLQGRSEFNKVPVGVLGDSMGGIIAFPLAVEDERIQYVVSLVAAPQPAPKSPSITSISPQTLAEKLNKPIFVLSAKQDQFYSAEQMQTFIKSISSKNKKHVIVDEPHDYKDTHADEIAAWVVGSLAAAK